MPLMALRLGVVGNEIFSKSPCASASADSPINRHFTTCGYLLTRKDAPILRLAQRHFQQRRKEARLPCLSLPVRSAKASRRHTASQMEPPVATAACTATP